MQVSHSETANTHAIMGGGSARAFGMSQSAEFFTVLSDTLYRDKKLAVIREVICNAWDAHIMSGKTDTPVEVTLNGDELRITDFGPGIHDDRIAEIYCVYGNSTKLDDEGQTGGFGLGSKAPFAYSDHFSVTSCHAGVKNVYALSRGGAETKGVPDLRVMVSAPTEESGITVSIPIGDETDIGAFKDIVRRVAYQGGMLVKLNGDLLRAMDYSGARKSGYMMTPVVGREDMSEARIYVLYGTVLYPVNSTDVEVVRAVHNLRIMIPEGRRVILVAPPGSVGVTPSREALSYSDMTIDTIKALCNRMVKQVKAKENEAWKAQANEVVQKAAKASEHARYSLPDMFRGSRTFYPKNDTGDTAFSVAKIIVKYHHVEGMSGYEKHRVFARAAARIWPDDRGTLLRVMHKGTHYPVLEKGYRLEGFRRATKLALRAARRAGLQDKVYAVHSEFKEARSFRLKQGLPSIAPMKTLVIAQNKTEAIIYASERNAEMQAKGGSARFDEMLFMCVSVPRAKKAVRESLKAEAEKLGFDVHCVETPAPKKPKVEKNPSTFVDLRRSAFGESLENPEYYIKVDLRNRKLRDQEFIDSFLKCDLSEFPNIAIVRNKTERNNALKVGAVDLIDLLEKRIVKKVKNREGKMALLLRDAKVAKKTKEDDPYFQEAVKDARRLVDRRPILFFEFVSARGVSKEAVIETSRLISAVKEAKIALHPEDGRAFLKKEAADAKEELDPLLMSVSDFEKTFENLKLISLYDIQAGNEELVARMIRMIRNDTPNKGDRV